VITQAEREFRAPTDDGEIVGRLRDGPADAPAALLLHGGPGLSDYLQPLADELDGLFPIAHYQQRGLAPSALSGPRTVERHVQDVVAVLDALGWDKAIVIGHSWGGHLAMHFAVAHPGRLTAFVSLDPLCATGDGGLAAFGANLDAQVPADAKARFEYLDGLDTPTAAERDERFRLIWPYYFGDPGRAAPFPEFGYDMRNVETWDSINAHLSEKTLENGLPRNEVPFLLIHGEVSPMPIGEARRTVEITPSADLVAVPGVGHWLWLERPGIARGEIARFLHDRL
jgi:pimeloyl-ACP methyl ester carboxylesterase